MKSILLSFFLDGVTEVQRNEVTCLRPEAESWDLNPDLRRRLALPPPSLSSGEAGCTRRATAAAGGTGRGGEGERETWPCRGPGSTGRVQSGTWARSLTQRLSFLIFKWGSCTGISKQSLWLPVSLGSRPAPLPRLPTVWCLCLSPLIHLAAGVQPPPHASAPCAVRTGSPCLGGTRRMWQLFPTAHLREVPSLLRRAPDSCAALPPSSSRGSSSPREPSRPAAGIAEREWGSNPISC